MGPIWSLKGTEEHTKVFAELWTFRHYLDRPGPAHVYPALSCHPLTRSVPIRVADAFHLVFCAQASSQGPLEKRLDCKAPVIPFYASALTVAPDDPIAKRHRDHVR